MYVDRIVRYWLISPLKFRAPMSEAHPNFATEARAKDYAWAMKSNAFALRVGTSAACLLCGGVWIVGCSESGPAPKPPTANTKVNPSARAPQGQASAATSAAGTASSTNPSATRFHLPHPMRRSLKSLDL
ncbi:MAG: hypothetical protein EBY29_13930 [Planctomycetes bacterium]|nr:hypothetical protein [Planctomycetota bacterium]